MKNQTRYALWKVILVGLTLVALRFYPAIIQDKVLIYGDNYSLQVPERAYTGFWLKQGIIPWWNPTVFAGIPWAHEISQTVFYPSTLFFTFLNPSLALNVTVGLHLLFTFWGMYLFLRQWRKDDFAALIGAVMWTFSTQVTGSINNLVTIQSISWFPWIVYFGLLITRKTSAPFLFGIVVLGQFLGGYPQHVIYAILLAVGINGLYEWRHVSFGQWLLCWGMTGFYTLGITAVAWLPFIEPFMSSTRVIQTAAQSATGSLHPGMLIKILLPYFFDNPAAGMKWGPAWSGFPNSVFYITWLGLLGLVVSVRKISFKNIVLLFVILFSLFLSMGSFIPGFDSLQRLVPFLKAGRYPSMILVCTNMLFIMLAITKINRLKNLTISVRAWFLIIAILILSLFLYVVTPTYFSSWWHSIDQLLHGKLSLSSFHTMPRDLLLFRNILSDIVVTNGLFLVGLLLLRKQMFVGAIIAIGLDMLFNTQAMLVFAPSSVYPTLNEIRATTDSLPFQLRDPQFRTITRNVNEPYTDFGMYWEALTVRAPFSDSFVNEAEINSFSYLKQIRDSFTPDWNMVYSIPTIHGYTTLLPQDYSKMWQTSADPRINFIDHINIENNLLRDWSVKNYIVDTQFVIREPLPTTISFSLSDTVNVYELSALPRFRFEDNSPVDISTLKENPNSIELAITNTNHTSLIVADRYDKNWHVLVNGTEQLLENHNGMRQIKLVSGMNKISLHFIPRYFYIGLFISVIFIAIGFVYFIYVVKRGQFVDSGKAD